MLSQPEPSTKPPWTRTIVVSAELDTPAMMISFLIRQCTPIGVTVLFRAKHTLSNKAACRAYSAQVPMMRKGLWPRSFMPLPPLLPHKHDSQGVFPEPIGLFCSSTPSYSGGDNN